MKRKSDKKGKKLDKKIDIKICLHKEEDKKEGEENKCFL